MTVQGPVKRPQPDRMSRRGHARARHAAIRRHPVGRCCVVVWVYLLAPGTSVDVLIWGRGGPDRAKGHFKDFYEVGASILPLTGLCF